MNAQVKALAAPVLREAVKGVLDVGKLGGKAHGEVTYENSAVGDVVALDVKTTTGNSFKDQITLTAATVGTLLPFAIPKDVFEKKLVPGATASLRYSVTRASNISDSPVLTVQLEL
ncbi:hypothetical protein [Pseudomonas fluorescens]|uniref:Uncharacterized protein n=1 Tax=Pseudomonas fluorescens TaxID=294 RepID=A0A5E6PXE5_PSEFL|nr:hypothetical protein [Pseudomonas fluorescens]VVM47587.1 hypothetical protein PS624_00618 [Pseudomonas fluorescens]